MIKNKSYFKNPLEDLSKLRHWVLGLEIMNGYKYDKFSINTSLGKTQIYSINKDKVDFETIVIFPGYRTTSLIWDLDKGLKPLSREVRIFLIETNGQPNLSEGNSPSIKSLDYGKWGAEIFDQLKLKSAYIAGASFGGLLCMKTALVIPKAIKAAILINPGCFRTISFGSKNLFYNLLPLLNKTKKNILKFLNVIVFHKPNHQLSYNAELHLIEYLYLAIKNYKDKTEKPYYMRNELNDISVDTYLLVSRNDILFPFKKLTSNAKRHLKDSLKEVHVFEDAGHGLECHKPCLQLLEKIIKDHKTKAKSF